jgi:hypothetical protein
MAYEPAALWSGLVVVGTEGQTATMKFKILSSKRKVKTALGVPVLNFL